MKVIEIIEKIIEVTIPFGIGCLANTLWISKSDDWKIILPIVLFIMGIQRIIDRYKSEKKLS